MKILVVLSRVPWPLEKGDKLRAYHLLREWSQNHEVTLFCLTDKPISKEAELKLNELCNKVEIYRLNKWGIAWRLITNIFSDKPFQVAYFNSKSIKKKFNQFLDHNIPDHIFCQLTRTVEYVKPYSVLSKSIDYMDAFSIGMDRMANKSSWPKSMIMRMEAKSLKQYETDIQGYFNKRFIISNQDREQLDHVKDLIVVPNGIDPKFLQAQTEKRDKTIDILFTGNMAYKPNIESAKMLVKEIMPIVWKKHPSIQVCLAGATPAQEVKKLESQNVRITGWVDDISAIYWSSKIFVAPMIVNTGLQNKLLEAMSCGVACITTSMANNALGAISGTDVIIADDPSSIAAGVIELIENAEKRKQIGDSGKRYVNKNFDWSTHALAFSEAFPATDESIIQGN